MWWDSEDGNLYTWFNDGNSTQWVSVSQGPMGHQGVTGSGGGSGSQGHQGVQGAQGHQGVQGAQGHQGHQGRQGAQGVQGAVGAQGHQGVQGAVGAQGAQGATGSGGSTGGAGAQGAQGHQGVQGSTGSGGSTGAQGHQGVQGAGGSGGGTGAQGHQGRQGATGSTGSNAGITAYNNPGSDRVITSHDSSTIHAESNLTFNGTTLSVDGNVKITGAIKDKDDQAGSAGQVLSSTGSQIDWVSSSNLDIPAGTKMVFVQQNAPTGWTKFTTHNDVALRVISGNTGGTYVAGDGAFSAIFATNKSSDNHTLTTAQIPSHRHWVSRAARDDNNFSQWNQNTQEFGLYSDAGSYSSSDQNHGVGRNTAYTGSGQGHSHNIDLKVHYVDTIIATKD
jgi:hypothetical protein